MKNIQSKINSAWELHQVNLDKTSIYNIFTEAWNYRWWKTYSKDKFFVILSWKAEVTILDSENNDVKVTYQKQEIIKIPAWVPNIFYFPEDSEMLEWFPIDIKTEKFERYYSMKLNNNL